jgi:hypothetical protein
VTASKALLVVLLLALEASLPLSEPQAPASNTSGRTAADSARERDMRTRKPSIHRVRGSASP